MNALNDMAAELLETSAAGYAAAALAELQKTKPSGEASVWKTHLAQRVLELAAAVRVAEPALFARRVQWLQRAARARGTGEQDLKRALDSLRAALRRELPPSLEPAVRPALDLAASSLESVPAEAARLDASQPNQRLALSYLSSCLDGRPQEAIAALLRALDDGLPPSVLYTQVLLAAEKEIGELWHVGDVSIAEEHLVSETTRELMALVVARAAPAEPRGPKLMAASISGNAHDLGLRAAADLFRIAGWRCLYLGANVPARDIGAFAASTAADVVLLNATLTTQLKALAEAVATVRALAPSSKLLVGGLAFDGLPELWRELKADAYAPSIDMAVDIGAKLAARD